MEVGVVTAQSNGLYGDLVSHPQSVESGTALVYPPRMVHSPTCTKPSPRYLCNCGGNVSCANCGWGSGSYPCRCTRERMNAAQRPYASLLSSSLSSLSKGGR